MYQEKSGSPDSEPFPKNVFPSSYLWTVAIFVGNTCQNVKWAWSSDSASKPGLPDFTWCKVPKLEKIYQIITKCVYPMAIKYIKCAQNRPNVHKMHTNIVHCKTLQNLPKFGFLVWKYTYGNPDSNTNR
jgi:hypothetical protein